MEFEDIDKASAWRLILAVKTTNVPALARKAAVRLYQLGKKKYAIDFLIKQMDQYKFPTTHRNIISETCPEAAKELGRLGDQLAIEPLFEALGELGYGPAIGLAQHGDPEIEKRLVKLTEGESKVAVFAALCLGYMKNELIVPRLIHLMLQHNKYERVILDRISRLRGELILILGAYKNNVPAEHCFRNNVNKADIDWILSWYLYQDQYPSQRWLEWEIVNKYQWQEYVKSANDKFVLRHINIERWKEYSDVPCPFTSENDITDHREQILDFIIDKYFR